MSTKAKCGKCQLIIKNNEDSVECELCNLWFHKECEGISKEEFALLVKSKLIHWYCERCNGGMAKTLKLITVLQEKQDTMEKKVNEVNDRLDGLHQSFSGVALKLENLTTGFIDMKREILNEAKTQMESIINNISGPNRDVGPKSLAPIDLHSVEFRQVVREESYEMEERRKRIQSIVIRGLGNSPELIIGKMKEISQMLTGKEIKIEDVVIINENLVRAKISNDWYRKALLSVTRDLRDIDEYKDVYISKDLTRNQRIDLARRREERKKLSQSIRDTASRVFRPSHVRTGSEQGAVGGVREKVPAVPTSPKTQSTKNF